MPIRRCLTNEILKPKRGRKAAIDTLEEFVQMKTLLSVGLKPQEAIEVVMPPNKPKNLRQTFKAKTVEYLREMGLYDFSVECYVSNGRNVVIVAYDPPITTQQPHAA